MSRDDRSADELAALLTVAHGNLDQLDRLTLEERRQVCAAGEPLPSFPAGPTEIMLGETRARHLHLVR